MTAYYNEIDPFRFQIFFFILKSDNYNLYSIISINKNKKGK